MERRIIVHTPTEWENKAAQLALFAHGFKWSQGPSLDNQGFRNYKDQTCLYANPINQRITYGNLDHAKEEYTDTMIHSLEGFIARLRKYEKPFKLGEYAVTDITKDGFKAGCAYITWKQAEEVMKLRPEVED